MQLFAYFCQKAGIEKNPVCPQKRVEVIHRRLDGVDYYYAINFTAKDTSLLLDEPMEDVLGNCTYQQEVPLERNGFALLKRMRGQSALQ